MLKPHTNPWIGNRLGRSGGRQVGGRSGANGVRHFLVQLLGARPAVGGAMVFTLYYQSACSFAL